MPADDAFFSRYGFRRAEVSLDNWRLSPYSTWSFQNVSEIVPSATISAAPGLVESPMADAAALLSERIAIGSERPTVQEFLRRSNTDAFVVMNNGKVVADYHAAHHDPRSRHIVFSISKSLTAMLAGMLEADGLLDPAAPISDYVPETASSAYADATVRHLLDMTVSLDFDETYLDPESAFARYRRAMLWNPQRAGDSEETLIDFAATLQKGPRPHGMPFRYRSPNSDLLGVVVERASGQRFAGLLSERLWGPTGLHEDGYVTVDRKGAARAAGGVCMTARDLARVGELMRCGGVANGKRILAEDWLRDTVEGGDAEAWRQGDFAHLFEKGRYRNKWYNTGFGNGAFCAIGIHGQWLWIDPAAGTVVVKFSSQPVPVDDPLDLECISLFQAVSAMV